jgi:hypothetical protein
VAALKAAVPNLEVHDTIDRAWKLHQRKAREAHSANLKARYDSLQHAMLELQQASPRLFDAAAAPADNVPSGTKAEEGKVASRQGRIPGLFPRQLRVPTETVGKGAFDEAWERETSS